MEPSEHADPNRRSSSPRSPRFLGELSDKDTNHSGTLVLSVPHITESSSPVAGSFGAMSFAARSEQGSLRGSACGVDFLRLRLALVSTDDAVLIPNDAASFRTADGDRETLYQSVALTHLPSVASGDDWGMASLVEDRELDDSESESRGHHWRGGTRAMQKSLPQPSNFQHSQNTEENQIAP